MLSTIQQFPKFIKKSQDLAFSQPQFKKYKTTRWNPLGRVIKLKSKNQELKMKNSTLLKLILRSF